MNARQRMQGVVPESLGAALEREHREIDRGIESYTGASSGTADNAAALEAAIVELRRHIYLEEEFLFPALAAGNLVAPLFVMLREHGQMWQRLDAVAAELRSGADPGVVRQLCHQLGVQLLHHNMKEERIIYPACDELIDATVAAKLGSLLESEELPGGWVCTKAQT